MPHDKLAELTGNPHARHIKGTPFEHNPHKSIPSEEEIDKAVTTEARLVRMR